MLLCLPICLIEARTLNNNNGARSIGSVTMGVTKKQARAKKRENRDILASSTFKRQRNAHLSFSLSLSRFNRAFRNKPKKDFAREAVPCMDGNTENVFLLSNRPKGFKMIGSFPYCKRFSFSRVEERLPACCGTSSWTSPSKGHRGARYICVIDRCIP